MVKDHSDSKRGRKKEGRNVLFKNTLNTFYLWLYGVRHMVKDHSDSERWNLLPPHGLLFLIRSKGSFICIIPHTTTFVTPEIAQWVHHEGSIQRPITPWVDALTTELHLALGHQIDPSSDWSLWWTYWTISCSSHYFTTGVTNACLWDIAHKRYLFI